MYCNKCLFFKGKKKNLQLTAFRCFQCYSILDYDDLLTSILDYFGIKQVRQRHVDVDERLIECLQGVSPQNDSFVKVRHV